MVIAGDFPLPEGLSVSDVPPRVGDGLMRLDRGGIVEFASPNASSAFHRLGLGADLVGSDLATTASRLSRTPGPADEALSLVASGTVPGATQIENAAAAVSLRAIPLREDGTRHGALVLVRDVTDLRQREQALLNKDSTIREIHHRVKNNLQTVAALLRMQARRLDEPTARAALDEAVRRVSSIAVVHETLSHQGTEDADFDEAADRVVSLTQDLAPSVTVSRVGSAGMLSAELISPLAMAVAELLSNAVEHSFAPGLAGLSDEPQVVLRLMRSGRRVTVEVADNGVGLDADFAPGTSGGLGVKIVNTLVTEVLKGTVNWEKLQPNGTKVVIDFLS
jgi:two-component sensor histidine kinase